LEIVTRLVERVLRAVIWNAPPGPDGFNHLTGFHLLNGFGLVFIVGGWEWVSDDFVQYTGGEAI
jgi:hypothetical protein